MRGSIQYDALFFKTVAERQIMTELISSRIEAQAKAMPVTVF